MDSALEDLVGRTIKDVQQDEYKERTITITFNDRRQIIIDCIGDDASYVFTSIVIN